MRYAAAGRAVFCALVLMATVPAADAHSVAGRVLDGKAAIAEFRFSTGEPMSYAETKVFAPGSTEVWQVGRADGSGRYAFVPDKPGAWRVEAREEEGHTAVLEIQITNDFGASAQLNRFWTFVLWLSVALNLGILVYAGHKRAQAKASL